MIRALIELIIWLIIAGVVLWAARYVANALPLDPTIKTIINVVATVVAVIICLIALLNLIGVVIPGIDMPKLAP
jgi:hypothetical protein